MDDPRFNKLFTDPKFRNVPKKERKVKIDQRFQSLFKDKKFVSKVSVDKRGRPGNFSTKENYEKFYHLDSSDDEEEKEKSDVKKSTKKTSLGKKKSKDIDEAIKDTNVDYARGEAFLTDSSSEEEDSSDEEGITKDASNVEEQPEKEFDKWGELDHDADSTEEATSRLAVCNMDWDRVGADDLFLVLSSFCPPGGRLLKVSIFPSQFGKERMAEEEQLGPRELRGSGRKVQDSDSESDENNAEGNSAQDMEKVRKYQINRLKYYYAVAEFNSVVAANRVYQQCDGNEYELSATRFDLRFVPDEMDFNDDPPREVCDQPPEAERYRPKYFDTTALSLGKVGLTWDETDPQRLAAMRKAFENEDEDGEALKQYLATSSGDEHNVDVEENEEEFGNEDDDAIIAKYRALLQGADKEDGDDAKDSSDDEEGMNMEMTFVPEADRKKALEEKEVEKMTPWEKYLHKKKEKRKQKRSVQKAKANEEENDEEDKEAEESEDDIPSDVDLNDPFFKEALPSSNSKTKVKNKSDKKVKEKEEKTNGLELLAMDSDDDRDHFDYKEIVKQESKSQKKKKKKAKKDDKKVDDENFQLDLGDSRFSAVFNNPKYNVDPSHPSFKKTKSMVSIIEEKQKRILKNDKKVAPDESEPVAKSAKLQNTSSKSDSLASLVNSVKSKSNRMKRKRSSKS